VRGFIRTGSPSIDSSLSLLTLDRAREVLGYEADESIQVALFIGDQRAADRVAARLGGLVGPETQALAWHSVQPDLSAFITMKVAGARFMEIIIMLLVAAGIFNTLFVSVMERLREFGIMLALGFSPGRLFRLVMLESLWVALLGLVLGVLVTAGPYYYLSTVGIDVLSAVGVEQADIAGVAMPSVIRAGIYPQSAIMIAAAALLATLLAGLYPAWRASSVEPVESIRLV
jgi:ABC-type lipoprotein release transport system permease subunit